MDDGDLAPELGYLGVPRLGVYAYTHWEWGQFLGTRTRASVASLLLLSVLLSFSVVTLALSGRPGWLWVGPCRVGRRVFRPLRAACVFALAVPPLPSLLHHPCLQTG